MELTKFITNYCTSFFIAIYGIVKRSGMLELPFCKSIFINSYFFYKRNFENPLKALISNKPGLFINGDILDIGGNVGYTAVELANILTRGYKLHVFEPDAVNFLDLKNTLKEYDLESKVVATQAAVGENNSIVRLWHNDRHHGDHRILTDKFREQIENSKNTTEVLMLTIDEYYKNFSNKISFIKIDVQGYELQVCKGMLNTLQNNPQAVIFFEYSATSMSILGFESKSLVSFFIDFGYHIYKVENKGDCLPVSVKEIEELSTKKDYFDLLATRTPI